MPMETEIVNTLIKLKAGSIGHVVDGCRPETTYMDFQITLSDSNEWPRYLSGTLKTFNSITSQETFHLISKYSTNGNKVSDILEKIMSELGIVETHITVFSKLKTEFIKLAIMTGRSSLSQEHLLCLSLFNLIFFLHDDIVEKLENQCTNGPENSFLYLFQAHDLYIEILSDNYGQDYLSMNYPTTPEIPLLNSLSKLLKYFHSVCHKFIPHYVTRNGFFIKQITKYFKHYELSHDKFKMDKNFSEESIRYWQRLRSGLKPSFEFLCLINEVEIPAEVRKNFYFKRLLMASADSGMNINDTLGISRDLKTQDRDGLIMFKHYEKGIPLIKAFQQTVEFLNEQMADMILFIEILKQKFPQHLDDVSGFIPILKRMVDGYMIWCASSKRYGENTLFALRDTLEFPVE